jgi:hypothetical protein
LPLALSFASLPTPGHRDGFATVKLFVGPAVHGAPW